MPSRTPLSALFPDRTPTWTDVLVGLLALAWIPLQLRGRGSIAPLPAALGFVAVLTLLGPVAATSVGRRAERRFRETDPVVRAMLVLVLLVPLLAALRLTDPPSAAVVGGAVGGMVGIAAFVLLHVLHAGEVSGWTGD